ncbi:MAG: site-specific integrase [Burkholderiales bacterium]|nr:site-specific integrase [Burkholderiales bacterium]
MKLKLTQEFIQTQLRCPEGKGRVEYCDTEVPGLYVEARATSPGEGTFYLRYKDRGGKTCHQKLGRTGDVGLAEARKAAKTMRAEISLGQRDPRAEAKARTAVPTFAEFFRDHYLPHAKPRKRSWKRDEQLYRLYLDGKFGHKRLNELSRKELIEHHASLLNQGLSPASADHMAKLARRCLALSQEWQLIDSNPLSRFPLFNANNQVERLLDGEQLGRLLEVLRTDRSRAVCQIAMFLLSTGARLNEALSATWDQVDIDHRVWKIAAAHSKSKRIRSVPLNDSALAVLEEVGVGTAGPIFLNAKTKARYVSVRKVWLRLCAKAGLPGLRLHDLRHQYASLLVNGGRSLYEVQAILGHSSPTVTQRYAHLSTRALQEAAGAASVLVKPVTSAPAPAAANAVVVVAHPAPVERSEAANAPTTGGEDEAPHQPEAGQRAA